MNRARVQRRGLRGPRTVFLVAFLVAAFLAQLSVTARGGSAETTTGQPSDEHTFGHQTQEQGSASGEDQHSRHAFSHLRLGRPGRGSGLSSQRFPEDLYAQPAFKIIYDDQNPVRNASALDFLQASSSDLSLRAPTAEAALVAGQGCAANPSLTANGRGPGTHQLIRSSRDTVHLCHIPTPRTDLAHEALYSSSAYLHQILHNASGTSDARQEEIAVAALESERKRIIAHGLTLLEPLKNYCLYQTADWFTYAFCHGRSIRQFKALPPATAVNVAATQQQKAHQAGASSTLSEEEQRRQRRQAQSQIVERQLEHGQIVYEVKLPSELAGTNFKALIPPQEPIEDKDSDAYVLGRWNRGVETIAGTKLHFTEWERGRSDDEHPRRRREVRKGTIEDGSSHKLAKDEPAAAIMHDRTSEATSAASGTELMEVTRFGAGEEQRYLAQPWTDGTRCKVNGEPRMTEVQVSSRIEVCTIGALL
ncbi:hypothetical protein K437DRAFT_71946 [Tilletiaria anomala UBC 951]|uniref:Protein OS-9 homolog n=1 Tax=Tilletiaria anomala (strain ATCC 24038 / CBS 436.72 / UBC 951) TaxID=1037660 RepID=A0A066WHI6_TILAU|nr:uncharacterized protein K437DRAFT_71946 [Tilletiaria anomala UBC 951]KDN53452.1 hypothetical protein K437DRAFT_71946 [Tilletiaria anomala UBC 951]